MAAAGWAGLSPRRDRHRVGAGHAEGLSGRLADFEHRSVGDSVVSHDVEAEADRLGIDVGERADAETHLCNAAETVGCGLLLYYIKDALAQRHFMHRRAPRSR